MNMAATTSIGGRPLTLVVGLVTIACPFEIRGNEFDFHYMFPPSGAGSPTAIFDVSVQTFDLVLQPSKAGPNRAIAYLEFEIAGLTHSSPADINIFLFSPLDNGGNALEIIDDRGDQISISGVTLVFSDDASAHPPANGEITSGRYLPDGDSRFDQFYDGSVFGTAPWRVIVIDDNASGSGTFDSITLRGNYVPCTSDADCDDGVKCTADVCDLATNNCSNDPIMGCCSLDSDCDDGSQCTTDICDLATNTCINEPLPCCCASDDECDDGLKCTIDICDLATDCCDNNPIPDCCTSSADCDDEIKCTLDVCDLASNTCSNSPIDGCCASDADCDDGLKCTSDVCDQATNRCAHDPIAGCCVSDVDCLDGVKCTDDVCDLASNICLNDPIAGCCSSDADCNDSNQCTTDFCDLATNTCSITEVPGCCRNDDQCDDGDECTVDVCSDNVCEHSEIPGCPVVPTVSEWGIIVMSMLLLIGARIHFDRRRQMTDLG